MEGDATTVIALATTSVTLHGRFSSRKELLIRQLRYGGTSITRNAWVRRHQISFDRLRWEGDVTTNIGLAGASVAAVLRPPAQANILQHSSNGIFQLSKSYFAFFGPFEHNQERVQRSNDIGILVDESTIVPAMSHENLYSLSVNRSWQIHYNLNLFLIY